MTDDDQIKRLLDDVAADVEPTTDHEALSNFRAAVAGQKRVRRGPSRAGLVILSAAAVTVLVIGSLAVSSGGGEDDIDIASGDSPSAASVSSTTNTTLDPCDDTSTEPCLPTSGTSPATAMVVVDRNGDRVVAYFSDGSGPIFYEPGFRVVHAELDRSGRTFWLTVEDFESNDTDLLHVDPDSGTELERIDGAGYAAIHDGQMLAYSIVSTYGGTDQAVVIRDLETGDERRVDGDSQGDAGIPRVVGSFRQLRWSPDGTKLLVDENWEDSIMWVVDVAADTEVADGISLGVSGADWLTNDRLIAAKYCCYDDPDVEPFHLAEVDLSGAEPEFIDRPELTSIDFIITAAADGLDTAVYVDQQNRLVRLADGSVVATDVISVQW